VWDFVWDSWAVCVGLFTSRPACYLLPRRSRPASK
jgi:hypothetical protein